MPGIIEPEGPPAPGEAKLPLSRRLIWFVALSLGGAGATAVVAYALRALLHLPI